MRRISSSQSRPVFGGDLAKNIDADVASVSGTLTAVDTGKSGGHYFAIETIEGTYGVLAIQQDGSYVYTLDTADAAVAALEVGSTLTDTFTVHNFYRKPATVTITIDGVVTP